MTRELDRAVQCELAHELYVAMQRLGAPSTILAYLGSLSEGIAEPSEVLSVMRRWNQGEQLYDCEIASITNDDD